MKRSKLEEEKQKSFFKIYNLFKFLCQSQYLPLSYEASYDLKLKFGCNGDEKKRKKTSIGLIYLPPFLRFLTFSFFAQNLWKKKKKWGWRKWVGDMGKMGGYWIGSVNYLTHLNLFNICKYGEKWLNHRYESTDTDGSFSIMLSDFLKVKILLEDQKSNQKISGNILFLFFYYRFEALPS